MKRAAEQVVVLTIELKDRERVDVGGRNMISGPGVVLIEENGLRQMN